jgi:plastocyanin
VVSGNQFSPGQITIAPGASVSFTNVSGTTHNVTFSTAGAPANVPDFSSGTRTVSFPSAGSYAYHCTIHGLSMSGVVLVQ